MKVRFAARKRRNSWIGALIGITIVTVIVLAWRDGGSHPFGTGRSEESGGQAGPPRADGFGGALQGLLFEDDRVRLDLSFPREISAPPVSAALDLAHQRLQAGAFESALEAFAEAVRRDPREPEAVGGLGRVLFRLKDSVRARAALLTALDLAPADTELRYQLGNVLSSQGRRQEALSEWRRVVDEDPDHGPSHGRLAATLFLLGEGDAAKAHLDASRRLGEPVSPMLKTALDPAGLTVLPQARTTARSAAGSLQVQPPVRVDSGGTANANEPSIAAVGQEMVAGWNDERATAGAMAWSLGAAVSLDGGQTWHDCLLRPPGVPPENFEGDPMTASDPRTGNLWVGGISFFFDFPSIFVSRKAPGAASFTPPVVINDEERFFDKGWLVAGPAPSGSPASEVTRLYVAYNLGLQWSVDLGDSWSPLVPLDPAAIGHHPRVGPGGELYISYWDFELGNWLVRSFDGGETLEGPFRTATRLDTWSLQDGTRAPGQFRLPNISFLAVDPVSGTLYSAYQDTTSVVGEESDLDVYLTRSTNRGETWDTPWVVTAGASSTGDQFFPWLEVDARGRLHLLYFDTRNTPQSDEDLVAMVDVYYALSEDGGGSWEEVRLTDSPLNTADAVWERGGQFIGDYLGAVPVGDSVHVIYPTTENGDLDVWTRRIDLPSPGLSSLSGAGL